MAETLAALEVISPSSLDRDDRLDRRGLVARMRTGLFFERQLERWRTDPQVHCRTAIDSIFDLLIRHPDRPSRVLAAVESRLGRIPDFLHAGLECEKRPVPLWKKLAISACGGAVEFLAGLESELPAVSPDPARTIASPEARAIPAPDTRPIARPAATTDLTRQRCWPIARAEPAALTGPTTVGTVATPQARSARARTTHTGAIGATRRGK
jgi:hypothetical protein